MCGCTYLIHDCKTHALENASEAVEVWASTALRVEARIPSVSIYADDENCVRVLFPPAQKSRTEMIKEIAARGEAPRGVRGVCADKTYLCLSLRECESAADVSPVAGELRPERRDLRGDSNCTIAAASSGRVWRICDEVKGRIARQ